MNILFFHRRAAAQHVGVPVLDEYIASGSFADDVALVVTSLSEVQLLVGGYQSWCNLLGIHLHLEKAQLWSLQGRAGERIELALSWGPLVLETRATFRIVGWSWAPRSVLLPLHTSPGVFLRPFLVGDMPTAVVAQLWQLSDPLNNVFDPTTKTQH